jgi:apolipoprotein N-acyltransferase
MSVVDTDRVRFAGSPIHVEAAAAAASPDLAGPAVTPVGHVHGTSRARRRFPPRAVGRRALGRPHLGSLAAVGGALAAGALQLAATPPAGLWPCAPLAVALLAAVVNTGANRHRRPLLRAYGLAVLTGGAYLLPLLAWTRTPGVAAWLILATMETLFYALIGPALLLAGRLPGPQLVVGGAGAWVLGEWLRDTFPFGGFPWARLAFTQSDSPYTGLAALGGAPLVSAVVAASGLSVFVGWRVARRAGVGWRPLVSAGIAGGLLVAGLAVPRHAGGVRALQVALVQGNVPRAGLGAFSQKSQVLRNHVRRTMDLAAAIRRGQVPRPDVVLWPENSSDIDPLHDPAAADLITVAAAAVGAPVLVGAVLDGPRPGTVLNAGLLWGSQGYAGQIYIKQHPVPFGEYLPFRGAVTDVFPRAGALIPNDFLPGRGSGLFRVAHTQLGDVICFEVAYDGIVRDTVRAGAQILVVQTNNATFGRGGETWQQLAMARLRAVEHDRAVLQVATSGVSAVIQPDGHVTQRTALFTADVLSARVPLRSDLTLADRLQDWPERVLMAVGLAALLVGGVRYRAGRMQRKGAQS